MAKTNINIREEVMINRKESKKFTGEGKKFGAIPEDIAMLLVSAKEKQALKDLEKIIIEQSRELEQRSEAIDALQRNFESLSDFCQAEKIRSQHLQHQIEELTKENEKLKEKLKSDEAQKEKSEKEGNKSANGWKLQAEKLAKELEKMKKEEREKEGEISSLEEGIRKLKIEREKMVKENNSWKEKLNKYEKVVKEQESGMAALKRQALEKEEEIEKLRQVIEDNDKLKKEIEKLQHVIKDNEKLKKEIEKLQQVIKDNDKLKKEIEKLRQVIKDYEKEVSEKEKLEIEKYNSINGETGKMKEEWEKKERELQKRIEALADESRAKDENLKKEKGELESALAEIETLQRELRECDQAKNEESQKMKKQWEDEVLKNTRYRMQMSQSLEDITQAFKKLKGTAESNSIVVQQLLQDFNALSSQSKATASTIVSIASTLSQYKANVAQLIQRSSQNSIKMSQLEKAIEEKAKELAELAQRLTESNLQISALASENSVLKSQMSVLSGNNSETITKLTKSIIDLKTLLETKQREIALEKEKREKAEGEVEKTKESVAYLRKLENEVKELRAKVMESHEAQIQQKNDILSAKLQSLASLEENMKVIQLKESKIKDLVAKVESVYESFECNLTCLICTEICKNCTICIPCGHCYCSKCVAKLKSCPNCNQKITYVFESKMLDEISCKFAYNKSMIATFKDDKYWKIVAKEAK